MANFAHKGIEIVLDERYGDFDAVLNGKKVSAQSLPAMKKKIDAALAENFQPFVALRPRKYNDPEGTELFPVKIIRKEKDERGRYGRGGFIAEDGTKYRDHLLPDTQEARTLYAAYLKAETEYSAADKKRRVTREAIPYIKFGG